MKKDHILFLDTVTEGRSEIHLISLTRIFTRLVRQPRRFSEYFVQDLQKLLHASRLSLDRLKAVVVVAGPGPFTSVRSAVALGNALAFSINIPITGLSASDRPVNLRDLFFKKITKGNSAVKPLYSGPPHITQPQGRKGKFTNR